VVRPEVLVFPDLSDPQARQVLQVGPVQPVLTEVPDLRVFQELRVNPELLEDLE